MPVETHFFIITLPENLYFNFFICLLLSVLIFRPEFCFCLLFINLKSFLFLQSFFLMTGLMDCKLIFFGIFSFFWYVEAYLLMNFCK